MKSQISITPIEKMEISQAAKLCAEAFISTLFTSTVMGGQSEKNLKKTEHGNEDDIKWARRSFCGKRG